uniref:Cytochrome b6-f complex subunit 6 n=1 Tax=Lygodium japonicum TaxID=13824 RepID=S4UFS6_LYGJA|nr:cytochrome b6-f complex subunit 6 [Lygodium japonicum]AGI51402.1 cytochrome b6-f complex subunit 6 [Lygodium japonicum]AHA59637.1 cytochrome b6/f complex subunit VI [Lygodium japonicum]
MFISISYFGFLLSVLIVTLILFIGLSRIQLL